MRRMRLVLCVALLVACGDDRAPTPDTGPPDVGVDSSAPDAADVDAGPCGVCEGATPFCDEARTVCVACLMDEDCGGLACNNGTCVGCTETEECVSPSASVCSAEGECVPCISDSGCAHLDGACVSGMCMPYAPTCAPCTASEECGPNGACIPMFYRGEMLTGSWCVRRAPIGACETAPYGSRIRGRASIERTRVDDWCGPDEMQTTCTAVNQAVAAEACSADDQCGVAELADASCDGTCTIPCSADVECPSGESCDSETGNCQ